MTIHKYSEFGGISIAMLDTGKEKVVDVGELKQGLGKSNHYVSFKMLQVL